MKYQNNIHLFVIQCDRYNLYKILWKNNAAFCRIFLHAIVKLTIILNNLKKSENFFKKISKFSFYCLYVNVSYSLYPSVLFIFNRLIIVEIAKLKKKFILTDFKESEENLQRKKNQQVHFTKLICFSNLLTAPISTIYSQCIVHCS